MCRTSKWPPRGTRLTVLIYSCSVAFSSTFLFFFATSSIIAFVADTQLLKIGHTHEYTVRRKICCLSRASGVTVVVSGPSMVSMVGLFFHVLPVPCQSLRLSQTHNFAHRHCARRHNAASDGIPVTRKWRYFCRFWALCGLSGVPIGALWVVLQQWLVVASVRRTFLVG